MLVNFLWSVNPNLNLFSFNKHIVSWGQPSSTPGGCQGNPHVCNGCCSRVFRPTGASDDWSCWTTTGNLFLSLNNKKKEKKLRKTREAMRSNQRNRKEERVMNFFFAAIF